MFLELNKLRPKRAIFSSKICLNGRFVLGSFEFLDSWWTLRGLKCMDAGRANHFCTRCHLLFRIGIGRGERGEWGREKESKGTEMKGAVKNLEALSNPLVFQFKFGQFVDKQYVCLLKMLVVVNNGLFEFVQIYAPHEEWTYLDINEKQVILFWSGCCDSCFF